MKHYDVKLRLVNFLSLPNVREDGKVRALSLRVNFTWSLIGNVIYAASQWGILVVLAKVGTPETVGQFTLALAICAPIVMFTNLQLRAIQATDANELYEFGHYLGLRLVMSTLALVTITMVAVASSYGPVIVLTVAAIALAKAFESISDITYGLFQRHERMDRVAISMGLKGPASLLIIGLTVWWTGSIVLGAAALALTWLTLFLLYDLGKARELAPINPLLHTRRLWQLAKEAMPLGVVMLLLSLSTNVPRYVVEDYLDVGMLGIFAAMAYLIQAGNMVVTALGSAASSRLANLYAQGDSSGFNRLLIKLIGIALLLGAGGIFLSLAAGKELLSFLYTPEYSEHATVLTWLMFVGAVQYVGTFFGTAVTAKRRFKVQVPIHGVRVLLTWVLSIFLIHDFGLVGAAWAMALSAAFATTCYGALAFKP